jgi:hypothetical protein
MQLFNLQNFRCQTDYFPSLYLSQAIESGVGKEIKLRGGGGGGWVQIKLRKQFVPLK